VPCLDRPHGIAVLWPWIVIADRGNHAIQMLRPGYGGRVESSILAGDPALPSTRFGLLRMGIQGPLGPEYGALGDPVGVAVDAWGDLYVADGPCLVQCSEPLPPMDLAGPKLGLSPGGRVASGLALEVPFTGPRVLDPQGDLDRPPHFFWKLECLDPATGHAAAPVTGEIRGRSEGSARMTLEEKGPVDLRLTCVTADGCPMQDTVRIQVD
jgi:hypothetical protein